MDHPLCKTNQLDRLAVVLPSHRAMSKLRRGLMTRLTGRRLPQFYALSGFIERLRLGQRRTRWKSWCGCIKWWAPPRTRCRLTGLCLGQGGAGRFRRRGPRIGRGGQGVSEPGRHPGHRGLELWEETWSEDQKAFERQWRRLPNCTPSCTPAWDKTVATRAHLTRKLAEGEGHSGRGSRACGRFGHHEHGRMEVP